MGDDWGYFFIPQNNFIEKNISGFGKIIGEWQDSSRILYSETGLCMTIKKEYVKIFPTLKEAVQNYLEDIPKNLLEKDGLSLTIWALAKRRFPSELHNLSSH